MESPSSTWRRVLSWSSWLGVCLLGIGALGEAMRWSPGPQEASAGERAEAESSPGQRDREDFGSPVWSLTASRDGARLGLSTLAGFVWVKDLAAGRSVLVEKGMTGSVRSLAFAPDGRVLAVAGSGSSVRLWDVQEGRLEGSIRVDGDVAKAVAFPPAGRLLAVGEWRRRGSSRVTIWDWRDGHRLNVLDGHAGGVNALAFSSDGSLLASGDSTGIVKLWEVASGRELSRWLACPTGTAIGAVALSLDGKRLATLAAFEGVGRLWDVARRQPIETFAGTEFAAKSLAFSPDGSLLAVARPDGTAALWESSGARELVSLGRRSAALQSVVFSGDGGTVASGGADGSLRLWGVAQAIGRLPASPTLSLGAELRDETTATGPGGSSTNSETGTPAPAG